MSKCNYCYHNKVCIDGANFKSADNCRQYKDKSLIVELPCNPGENFGESVFLSCEEAERALEKREKNG